jgi:hypothetical protein
VLPVTARRAAPPADPDPPAGEPPAAENPNAEDPNAQDPTAEDPPGDDPVEGGGEGGTVGGEGDAGNGAEPQGIALSLSATGARK